MAIFENPKEIMAGPAGTCPIIFWWINYFGARLSNGAFYLYSFLISLMEFANAHIGNISFLS